MTRVAVTAEVLLWAIKRSGRSPHDLEQHFTKLPEWQRGQIQPTLKQLEAFARATGTPIGFLFLDRPPEERLPIPHFRTVREVQPRRPSADLLGTVYAMQRRQAWMRRTARPVASGDPRQCRSSWRRGHRPCRCS